MTREASDRFLTEVCGWKVLDYWTKSKKAVSRWEKPDGSILNVGDIDAAYSQRYGGPYIPDPEGNLQDALAFVPEGHSVMMFINKLYTRATVTKDSQTQAVVRWPDDGALADTPAEALCAAIRKVKDDD